MSQSATAVPICAALSAPRPLSVDDAVRAVLSHRAVEARSFGNEDDMEGRRNGVPDVRTAPPAP
jgi:hypothetical protein